MTSLWVTKSRISNLKSDQESIHIHPYPSTICLRWRSSPGANGVQLLLSRMPDWQHSEEDLRPPGGPTVCQHRDMDYQNAAQINQRAKSEGSVSPYPLHYFQHIHDHCNKLISCNNIIQLYSHSHWNSCHACGHLEPTCIAPTSAASMWCPVMAKRSDAAAGKETCIDTCEATWLR